MQMFFTFPRKGVTPNLKDINDYLNRGDWEKNTFRRLGVYLEQNKKKKEQEDSEEEVIRRYILKFKFFDNQGKENTDYTIKIKRISFNTSVEEEANKLKELGRNVCVLSYVAALELQMVKFSMDEETLYVTVELNDSYKKAIADHQKLILSVI